MGRAGMYLRWSDFETSAWMYAVVGSWTDWPGTQAWNPSEASCTEAYTGKVYRLSQEVAFRVTLSTCNIYIFFR